jgi:hypothetical protein
MAGLIEEQMMPSGAMGAQQGMPSGGGQMMPQGGMSMGEDPMAMGEEDGPDENDPAFQTALQYAMSALYENGAARQVAEALKSAPDVVQGLSETAYEMTATVDERTEGQVPDEMIMPLGMHILQEVTDIATAAGVQVQPSDVAEAFKQMILRFLGEQGVDTTQLQQAMDQVDSQEFNRMAQQEA